MKCCNKLNCCVIPCPILRCNLIYFYMSITPIQTEIILCACLLYWRIFCIMLFYSFLLYFVVSCSFLYDNMICFREYSPAKQTSYSVFKVHLSLRISLSIPATACISVGTLSARPWLVPEVTCIRPAAARTIV